MQFSSKMFILTWQIVDQKLAADLEILQEKKTAVLLPSPVVVKIAVLLPGLRLLWINLINTSKTLYCHNKDRLQLTQ